MSAYDLSYNYAAIDNASDIINSTQGQLNAKADEIVQRFTFLGTIWTGAGSDSAQQVFVQFQNYTNQFHGALTKHSGALSGGGISMAQADRSGASLFG